MSPRWPHLPLAALSGLAPHQAAAHEFIPGVTGFPALLLHPVFISGQLLVIAGAGLVAGRMGRGRFGLAALAFLAGLALGKPAELAFPAITAYWLTPVVLTLCAGAAVAVLARIAPLPGAALIFALGFALAVGIVPDDAGRRGIAAAVAATMITGTLVLALVALSVGRIASAWGNVIVRVAGAWLAAISLMQLALAF